MTWSVRLGDVLTPFLPFALLFYEIGLGIVDGKLERLIRMLCSYGFSVRVARAATGI
jgi:hypothetical protein